MRLALYITLVSLMFPAQTSWSELQNVQVDGRALWLIEEPDWGNHLEDLTISITFGPEADHKNAVRAAINYTLPSGEKGEIVIPAETEEQNRYVFTVPASELAGMGSFRYTASFWSTYQKNPILIVYERTIPIGYAEELDITGEAAEVLLHPLPDDMYVARYIPCCNIYGGMTYAARVPVNPTETDEGLPAHLVSPFIVLDPDGMSASTMGLYLDMKYDPEAFPEKNGRIALYEFNFENTWSEVITYTVDTEKRVVTTHCPEGGSFVLAWVKD